MTVVSAASVLVPAANKEWQKLEVELETNLLTPYYSASVPLISTGPRITHAASPTRISRWPGIATMEPV